MGLLTTTVGWFPKPSKLLSARAKLAEGEIEPDELERVEGESRVAALRLQEQLGLDLLVDGQFDRSDLVGSLAGRIEGLEPGGLVRCFGNRYCRRPRIVGDLSRGAPVALHAWRAASAATDRPVKAVVTGPYTLMDWSFDEHYASRAECCLALAEIVRDEVRDLVDAGAAEIQIDEPAVSGRPEELDLVAEALGRVTQGLGGRARTWVQLCYGDLLPVIPAVFALPVDGLLLELANSGFELVEALRDLPASKQLGAGVLDVLTPRVETEAELSSRVERLLEHVDARRLWLVPDAGLRTLSADAATAKLRAMTSVAARY